MMPTSLVAVAAVAAVGKLEFA